MKTLIAQLCDVLDYVSAHHTQSQVYSSVPELRKSAVAAVAQQYGVHPRTVADGFIRRLRPSINSTAEFDEALRSWLNGNKEPLQHALLTRIGSGFDAKRVFDALEMETS